MLKSTPGIFKKTEEIAIGESNMNEHIGYPLQLSYTAIFVCMEGEAVINVNLKNYLLKANSILILAQDSIGIILRKSKDFKLFYCLINKGLASEIAYNLPNQLFVFLWESPLFILKDEERSLLGIWLEQTKYIMQVCTTHQRIMIRNHIQNFFLTIAEHIPQNDSLVQCEYSRKEMLCWKFWDLVIKHCTKHRDVAFYAKELSITTYYLSQITKSYFNESPKELINRQVILEIKSLLSSTCLSIKEIAEQLHFEDTSYMYRYFKRQVGVPLSEYRKYTGEISQHEN